MRIFDFAGSKARACSLLCGTDRRVVSFFSDARRGSATVEASLVIPVLVLVISLIISAAVNYEEKVKSESIENMNTDSEILIDDLMNAEDLLRGRWLVR